MDFSTIFENDYSFFLDKAVFTSISISSDSQEAQINLSDTVTVNMEKEEMCLSVKRKVFFVPQCLFDIEVCFCIILNFRKDNSISHTAEEWASIFAHNENPYFLNIYPRISLLISQLTSSHGQSPVITPPSFIQENGNS